MWQQEGQKEKSVAKSLSKVGWVWVAVVVVDAVDVDVFGSFAAPQVHRPFTSLPDMPEVAIQTQPMFSTSSTNVWRN